MSLDTKDFDFHLPDRLIARYPASRRSDSRLFALDIESGERQHLVFHQFAQLLNPGDLLVFNDTRVIPARLEGRKETGGKIEMLVERLLPDNRVKCQIRASKSPKPGTRLVFETEGASEEAVVTGREGDFFLLQFRPQLKLGDFIANAGAMPLPPYIDRQDEALDRSRYQTVYARESGAVAAPTAGLHFDDRVFESLAEKGVETAFLTLHVGAGTFQPVRVADATQHRMHEEYIEVSQPLVDSVNACRQRGGRVVAVGTTSVRALEAAASQGELLPFSGDTNIFIYPGYRFRVIDCLLTNFHLPQSTLLMLVSALASKKMILDAYREAVSQDYRFFSYGDAMFLHTGER